MQQPQGGDAAAPGSSEMRERLIPAGSLAITVLLVAIFALQAVPGTVFFSFLQSDVACISVDKVARMQLWRLFLHPFFHYGIFHIIFNSVAFASMGARMEKRVGTYRFICMLIFYGVPATSLMYVVINSAAALAVPGLFAEAWYDCAAGFSGLIFTAAALESTAAEEHERQLCGVRVSSKWYPMALLLLISILGGGGVSLIGHLCGLLYGLAWGHGLMAKVLPSRDTIMRFEGGNERPFPEWVTLSEASDPELGEQYVALDLRGLPSRVWAALEKIAAAVKGFMNAARYQTPSQTPPALVSMPGTGRRLGGPEDGQGRQVAGRNVPRGYAPVATNDLEEG